MTEECAVCGRMIEPDLPDGSWYAMHVGIHEDCCAPNNLDAAWRAAEAALPPGQTLDLTLEAHVDGGRYLAWTMRHTDTAIIRGEGPTPTAALRALTIALGRVASGWPG